MARFWLTQYQPCTTAAGPSGPRTSKLGPRITFMYNFIRICQYHSSLGGSLHVRQNRNMGASMPAKVYIQLTVPMCDCRRGGCHYDFECACGLMPFHVRCNAYSDSSAFTNIHAGNTCHHGIHAGPDINFHAQPHPFLQAYVVAQSVTSMYGRSYIHKDSGGDWAGSPEFASANDTNPLCLPRLPLPNKVALPKLPARTKVHTGSTTSYETTASRKNVNPGNPTSPHRLLACQQRKLAK